MDNATDTSYAYSLDEAEFFGGFASREEALAAGRASHCGACPCPVWTGVSRHALHFLRRDAKIIGASIAEQLDEWLLDDIVSDDRVIDIADPESFGLAILDLLQKHAEFNRFGISDVQRHEARKGAE